MAGYGMGQVIRLVSSVILTRLLAPDIYGVMSIGYLIITLLTMVSDIGLAALTIQSRNGDDPRFLNVVWITQIARGFMICLATLVVAYLTSRLNSEGVGSASIYYDPRIPGLFAVVSLYALFSGFDSTKVYLARRNLSLGKLTQIEIACQAVSAVFIICVALYSPTIWALAVGWVFGAIVRAILTHRFLPGPDNAFYWDRDRFSEILSFGKWTVLSSALSFMLTSGDRLLLGFYLTSAEMGHYAIAMVLFSAVYVIVLKVIGDAVLPALSEVVRDRPHDLTTTFYKARLPIDIICIVCSGLLVTSGPNIIGLLYDVRYQPAGWMLSVAGLVLLYTRLTIFDQCLVAQGNLRLLTRLHLIRLVILYITVPIAHEYWGSVGAVVAVSFAALLNGFVVLSMQYKLRIFNAKRELAVFPIFIIGLIVGLAMGVTLDWFGKIVRLLSNS